MIQDPAGLLQRIVELEPLCADPGIRRAVESGDTFKVYRAILWALLLGRLSARRATLETLAKNRRAFAKPLSGTPMLGTFNSFGATLLGRAEEEADGTCISTHYLVILFALPLFPIGAYVVRPGERKGLSSSWQIFARVPLAASTWLWSRGIALAVALAVVWAGLATLQGSRNRDVHIVNGFGTPLRATVGDKTVELQAGQHAMVTVRKGNLEARAGNATGTIESARLDVTSGSEVVVWNPGGAAPVLHAVVRYRPSSAQHDEPPRQTIHCGEEVVRYPSVNHVFTALPSEIRVSASSGPNYRSQLTIADTGSTPGWRACVSVLLSQGKGAAALRIMEQRARLVPWDGPEASAAVHLALAVSAAEGERVARAVAAALPGDTLVQRAFQDALLEAGKEAEVVADARRKAAAAPDSPQAQYLLARVQAGPEQQALTETLVSRFPSDPDVLRLATALRAERGDWTGVDRSWRALSAVSTPQAAHVLREETTALVALGRSAAALELLVRVFEGLPEDRERDEAAVLYAQVAARAKAGEPDALIKRLEKDGPDSTLRARAGLPASEADDRYAAFVAAVRRDAAAGLASAKTLSDADLLRLDTDVWGLVYAEAIRVQAAEAVRAFERRAHVHPAQRRDLERYVRGESDALPHALPVVLRAAAELVRSRNPALPAAERARLVAQARKDDHLGTAVTQASLSWKAPDAAR